MLSIVQAAGWPIWPLILASVIALTIIFERLLWLRQSRITPRGLLAQTVQEFRQSGVNVDMLNRLNQHSIAGRVFAAGLRNVSNSREVMREAVEEAGRAAAHEMERFLTTLGTIAAVSPLMGLFGTVVGMIEIFGAGGTANSNPEQLAHGISIALYNTGFGLVVAIPSMIFYRHFRGKIDGILVDLEQQAIKLVEVAHGDRTH